MQVLVVRAYAASGCIVGMCGDGGNDSGALRAAHAGLALSARAEASAAAPFSTDSTSLFALVHANLPHVRQSRPDYGHT